MQDIKIPKDILPIDARFGSGPSKVRKEQVLFIEEKYKTLLGNSHRQAPVKEFIGELKEEITSYFKIPNGYEIVFGNGGATAFWDVMAFSLINKKSMHLDNGEFSGKFANVAKNNPFIEDPVVFRSEPGTIPNFKLNDEVDLFAWAQNETSTGVMHNITFPNNNSILFANDATSAAGGLPVDISNLDVYYFSPQKCFGSDGGLWVAIISPKAIQRMEEIKASKRFIPDILSLPIAFENSVKNQTYNTPSLTTLAMMFNQIKWFNSEGGMDFTTQKTKELADIIYNWAISNPYTTPFVQDESIRSNVVATIDFDPVIDANSLSNILRKNGIVDTNSYRKLGRNQLRISLFPSIDTLDMINLTKSIDWILSKI